VGGSIAGVTLAPCLSKSYSIDFAVLEARSEIDAQLDASIGILPNGGRILNQLGLLDQIFNFG
jgi:FAD dependent monooxygenase